MEQDIHACPQCGGKPHVGKTKLGQYWVRCGQCGHGEQTTKYYDLPEFAIEAWNKFAVSDEKLKHCPFCGATAVLHQDARRYYSAQCLDCGIGTEFTVAKETAIGLWNRRVGDKDRE